MSNLKDTIQQYWWVGLLLLFLFGGGLYVVLGVGRGGNGLSADNETAV